MEAFTERSGHILYKQSLSRKYITPDPVCEIKGCAEYQRAINEQRVKEGYEPNGKIKLGLDHCHKHGYIRGIICNSCAIPVAARTHADVTQFFAGLDLVEPGVVQVHRWRPATENAASGRDLAIYAGVGRKP